MPCSIKAMQLHSEYNLLAGQQNFQPQNPQVLLKLLGVWSAVVLFPPLILVSDTITWLLACRWRHDGGHQAPAPAE